MTPFFMPLLVSARACEIKLCAERSPARCCAVARAKNKAGVRRMMHPLERNLGMTKRQCWSDRISSIVTIGMRVWTSPSTLACVAVSSRLASRSAPPADRDPVRSTSHSTPPPAPEPPPPTWRRFMAWAEAAMSGRNRLQSCEPRRIAAARPTGSSLIAVVLAKDESMSGLSLASQQWGGERSFADAIGQR